VRFSLGGDSYDSYGMGGHKGVSHSDNCYGGWSHGGGNHEGGT